MKPWDAISTILKEMALAAVPGARTMDIDAYAEKRIKELGAKSVNKGYTTELTKTPWPTVSCINTPGVICHGYPSDYALVEGDIVSFDLGIKIGNQCADAALTVGVGQISNARQQLLKWAKRTMFNTIQYMVPGASTEDLADITETYALSHGYLVNRRFGGHRIGTEMHMRPNIYNTKESSHKYAKLELGEIYCVEPMITKGKDNIGTNQFDPDGWCFITADGKDSAFFEHMVQITASGPKILTTHVMPD